MNIWIWSVTPENWATVESEKIWAVNAKGKGSRVEKGDKIVFYVKGTMHFYGAYQVKSGWHGPTIQWANESRVGEYAKSEIDLEEIQLGFASVDKLLRSLRFIERTSKIPIGMYLRGSRQGPANLSRPISEDDYGVILNELRQVQEQPSFRKDRKGNELEELVELTPQFHGTAKIPPSAQKTPEDIFQDVQKGRCAVPNFQRYWTWNKNQIEELWESIFQGYYIGSLLTWPSSKQKLDRIRITGGPKLGASPDLILDGQQRITAIYYAVESPDAPLPNTETAYKFFLDINAVLDPTRDPSEIIFSRSVKKADESGLHDAKVQYQKKIVPLTQLKDGNYGKWLFSFYRYLISEEGYSDDEAEKYHMRLQKIFDDVWTRYQIPVVILPERLPLDNVAAVFERINSKGTPLGIFDLLNARFIIYDIVLKDLWEGAKRRHDSIRKWYDEFNDKLPLYIIQALTLSRSGFLRRKYVLNLDGLYKVSGEFDSKQFSSDWAEMSGYMEQAIVRITSRDREGFGGVNYGFIPYTIMVPLIACMLKEIESKANRISCLDKIRSWYWNSILADRYSGSTDSMIESDFKIMKKWFDADDISEPFDVEEHSNFRIKKKNNALYKAVMCVIAKSGARDFIRGDLHPFGSLQDHRIFPRSKARDFGAGEDIDLVLNRTLIFDETNRFLADKSPSEYLSAIMREQGMDKDGLQRLLSTHLISPSAFECLLRDDFHGFIKAREQTIREEFKKLVRAEAVETAIDVRELLKGEDQHVEFKQTLRWDIRTKQINPALEEAVMKEIASFMNADGGKILIGVDDSGTATGLDPDCHTLKRKNSGSFQEHLTNLINKYLGKAANSRTEWSFHRINGKEVCLGDIGPSPRPVYITTRGEKKFYVRNNNTCQPYDVEESFDYISRHWH